MSKLAKTKVAVDKKLLEKLPQQVVEKVTSKEKKSSRGWPLLIGLVVIGALTWLLLQNQKNASGPAQYNLNPRSDKDEDENRPATGKDAGQEMGATESEVQKIKVPHTGDPADVKIDGEKTELIIDPRSELTPG